MSETRTANTNVHVYFASIEWFLPWHFRLRMWARLLVRRYAPCWMVGHRFTREHAGYEWRCYGYDDGGDYRMCQHCAAKVYS